MKGKDKNPEKSTAIALLNNVEIDGFVVAQLRRIKNINKILCDVVGGRIKTTPFQRKNAIYVLGRLGDQKAAATLMSTLDEGERSLRLGSLIALAAIDLDKDNLKSLEKFAESEERDSIESAYAFEAITGKRRRNS